MPQVRYKNGFIGHASADVARILAVRGEAVILRPRPTGEPYTTPPAVLNQIADAMRAAASSPKESPDA